MPDPYVSVRLRHEVTGQSPRAGQWTAARGRWSAAPAPEDGRYPGILRALKPGGRLVMSDVVCDEDPPAGIRNDETLRGECIGGALTQRALVGILDETGFVSLRLLKRFPYRTVQGHPFYSLTFEARKPVVSEAVAVIYRGPGLALSLSDGTTLHAGIAARLPRQLAEGLAEQVFLLDQQAARCCQRDCVLALLAAARTSTGLLPVRLRADQAFPCGQQHKNRECQGKSCPLSP